MKVILDSFFIMIEEARLSIYWMGEVPNVFMVYFRDFLLLRISDPLSILITLLSSISARLADAPITEGYLWSPNKCCMTEWSPGSICCDSPTTRLSARLSV